MPPSYRSSGVIPWVRHLAEYTRECPLVPHLKRGFPPPVDGSTLARVEYFSPTFFETSKPLVADLADLRSLGEYLGSVYTSVQSERFLYNEGDVADAYVENVVGDVLQALNVIMKEGEYLGEWTRNLRFSDYSEVKNELTLTKEDGTTQKVQLRADCVLMLQSVELDDSGEERAPRRPMTQDELDRAYDGVELSVAEMVALYREGESTFLNVPILIIEYKPPGAIVPSEFADSVISRREASLGARNVYNILGQTRAYSLAFGCQTVVVTDYLNTVMLYYDTVGEPGSDALADPARALLDIEKSNWGHSQRERLFTLTLRALATMHCPTSFGDDRAHLRGFHEPAPPNLRHGPGHGRRHYRLT